MEDIKLRYCKLCLTTIHDENYESIENNTNESLILVLLKLDCDNESKNILCNVCSAKLFAAKEFRMTCLCTNKVINSYIYNGAVLPLDLREIYVKERSKEYVSDDIIICCLCMEPINSALSKSIHPEQVDIIQKLVPEMNMQRIKEPVMCKVCQDSLALHCNFLKQCSDVQQHMGYISKGQVGDAPSPAQSLDVSVKIEKVDIEFEEDVPELIKTEHLDTKYEVTESESKLDLDQPQGTSSFEEHNNPTKKYNCEKCEYRTNFLSNLKKHEIKHKDPSEVPMYKCEICNHEIKNKGNLKRHMLKHKDPSEVPMYRCEICSLETRYKEGVERHMLTHKDPSGMQTYKCESCNFETTSQGYLKSHALVHKNPSEVQMYKCENCNYETKYRKNLKIHVLMHKDPTEVQMYKCESCNYQTKYKKSIQNHIIIHKDPSEVQTYRCQNCDYETRFKPRLKKHLLVHQDPSETRMYKPEKCDSEMEQKNNLNQYILVQNNPLQVQMYKCEHCNYRSKRKENLKIHLLIHKDPTKVQMYKCEQCNFQTKYRKSLKRHKMSLHPLEDST